MKTLMPNATRRFPAVTAGIILANVVVFILELNGGDALVLKWSAIPANITSGHRWITVVPDTAHYKPLES
jgi:membrane associated rhomboid family serine protease